MPAREFPFADGVNLKVIKDLIGHTRLPTTSEIYMHLLEEVKYGATDGMLVDLTSEREKRRQPAS